MMFLSTALLPMQTSLKMPAMAKQTKPAAQPTTNNTPIDRFYRSGTDVENLLNRLLDQLPRNLRRNDKESGIEALKSFVADTESNAHKFLIKQCDTTIDEILKNHDEFSRKAKWLEGFTEQLKRVTYSYHNPPAEDEVPRGSFFGLFDGSRRMDYVDKSGEEMHNPSRGGKSRKRFYKG